MPIVWACGVGAGAYVAAGRSVQVPRPNCPVCGRAMTFRSGYWRFVREGGAGARMWVRRAKCRGCSLSRALLPAFELVRRLDSVEVIGRALAEVAMGTGVRKAAERAGVPYETARGWRRRYRSRAPMLAAGFSALAVSLGGAGPKLSGPAEQAGLEALGAAWSQAQRRFGEGMVEVFEFASVITGGELLGSTTSPPWSGPGMSGLMPPVPVQP
jgi:transposase-like protein